MQKVGAQFAIKKISDYVMAPPTRAAEVQEEESAPVVSGPPDLDGQMITDDEGQNLGIARRVANVAVYLIADTRAGLVDQLKTCVTDPEARIFFHHDDEGRLSGLIYAPDPASRPAPVSATRADEI